MIPKFSSILSALIFCALFINGAQAQDTTKTKDEKTQHGQHFIDLNGDGYNDNAPDHDGDGIPNGLDKDWQKLKKQKGKGKHRRFVDLDGDGIDDNLQADQTDQKADVKKQMSGQDKGASMNQQQNAKGTAQRKRQGKN